MIDGVEGVSKQDARLAALIADRGRACIILINKWDKVKGMEDRNSAVVDDEVEMSLPHMSWAEVLYTSALTGKGCHRIIPLIKEAYKNFDRRISTSKLNKIFEQIVAQIHHPKSTTTACDWDTSRKPECVHLHLLSGQTRRMPFQILTNGILKIVFESISSLVGPPFESISAKNRKQWEDL